MTGQAYRLGQVAKTIGCSTYKLRRLCEAGLIDAELTGKGQWRIPVEECARLERDGLPPMPATIAESDDDHPTKVAAPSTSNTNTHLIDRESEAVQEERDSVAIAEARLKRRRLELDHEDVEDAFAERAKRRLEPLLADQRRREEAETSARHKAWKDKWLEYASNIVPAASAPGLRVQAHQAALQALNHLDAGDSNDVVTKLLRAAVEAVLQPFYRQQAVERAVSAAIDSLPAAARWEEGRKAEASAAARKAIATLGGSPNDWELIATAKQAVYPVTRRFESQQAKKKLVQEMAYWRWLKATAQEREDALEALKEALDEAPMDSTPADLQRLSEEVLEPFEDEVDRRLAVERERAEAQDAADLALQHVSRYLTSDYEFDSWTERSKIERDVRADLTPRLRARFLDGRLENQDDAKEFIERAIDEWLEEDDES